VVIGGALLEARVDAGAFHAGEVHPSSRISSPWPSAKWLPAILIAGVRPTGAGRADAADGPDALAGGLEPAEGPWLHGLAEQEASRITDAIPARKTESRGEPRS
jgi:hypothetical protein